jgi:chitinase
MQPRTTTALAALTLALHAATPADAASARLLAYYGYWDQWNSPAYTSANIPFNELTHIIHDGVVVEAKGTGAIKIPKGFLEPALLSKAHAAGDKVILNVSGSAGAFAKVAANANARTAFANNALALVNKYGYDGLDIDWEVPSAKGKANCTAFFQALRAALPAGKYLLTLAIPADPENYGQGFNVPALAPIVDYFNVMTYDFTGPWGSYTGHNSPLLQSPNDPGQEGSLTTAMQLFSQTYGVSPAQLNIGTAFYGYEFNGYGSLWQTCNGLCGNKAVSTVNYAQVKPLIGAQGWTAYRDQSAGGAPYLLHTSPAGFITFDDVTSTTGKVDDVIGGQAFGGMFMWELSLDYDGRSQDLLTAMYTEYQTLGYVRTPLQYEAPLRRF